MSLPDPNFVAQNLLPEDPNVPTEVKERAQRLGTWRQINRDPQYEGPDRAHPLALLNAVNKQGNYIRALQVEKDRMQHMMNLRLRNSIIVAFVTSVLTSVGTVAAAHFLR